jgi:hypothetical protein
MPDDAALSIETEREVIASEDTPVPHLLSMMDSLTPVPDLQPLAERAGRPFVDGAGGFFSMSRSTVCSCGGNTAAGSAFRAT